MAFLEKRVLLGVQNKKVPKKPKKKIAKKKRFIEKVVDYLISDSYLFAHLVPPSKFRSLKGIYSSKKEKERERYIYTYNNYIYTIALLVLNSILYKP